MDFLEAMRIKHGKQAGNMDEADQYFASLAPGQFKAMGASISRAGRGIKKKALKMGQRPRPSIRRT